MIQPLSYHSVLGRYELIGQLATGGMAEIHLARLAGEAGFEKIVVVKKLLPELVASKAFVTMFLDEAKLVARLDHPNVCEVYELGKDGAEYFIVMPYLDGLPASELRADVRVAAGVIVQACAGLHYAHDLEIVHRDVSPSNLFVTASGVVKVLDFGVAKVPGANATEAGTIKGKTQYMAPEQLLGQQLDRRCDVFALGVVLWELVTHRRLFARDSDYLTARAILEEPIPRADAPIVEGGPVKTVPVESVPAELADVIERALARDRNARYADARELGRAIEAAMSSHGGIASADDIAASLRASHGPALAAQRTKQHDLVEVARSHDLAAGSQVVTAARTAAGSQVVTAPRAAAMLAPASEGALDADDPRPAARHRVRVAVFFAAFAALVVLGVAAKLTRDRTPPATSDTPAATGSAITRVPATDRGVPDDDVRGSDTAARGSDSDVRGSDSDVRGSDGSANPRPAGGHPTDTRRPPDTHAKAPGTFSIDSTPFAKIFVDGQEFGVTPLIHRSLAAGHHKVRAVLADGRNRELDVDVPAGRAASPIRLSW